MQAFNNNNNNNITMEMTENENDNSEPIDTNAILQSISQTNTHNILDYDRTLQQIQSYEMNYTIKELHIICDYYGILKSAKSKKMKKQEIIECILLFENDHKNEDKVNERIYLWDLMDEFKTNPFMKKFVIW